MNERKQLFAEAIHHCQTAVFSDKGNSADRNLIDLYEKAVNSLNAIIHDLPQDIQPETNQRLEEYKTRLRSLEQKFGESQSINAPVAAAKSSKLPPFEFKEDSTLSTKFMALPPPPPDNPELRTFWLINILLGSTRRGGFLTTQIWVPKEAWYQVNVQLQAHFQKIGSLKYLTDVFDKIPKLNTRDLNSCLSDLDGMFQDVATVQNYLSTLVDKLPEVKLTITHSRDKKLYAQRKNLVLESIQNNGDQAISNYCGDTSDYVDALNAFFPKALALEKLLTVFENNEKLLDPVKRLNAFLGAFILLILSDLLTLLGEYFLKCKTTFLTVPSLD